MFCKKQNSMNIEERAYTKYPKTVEDEIYYMASSIKYMG